MNKLILAIASLAALLTIAACGPGNQSSESAQPAAEAPAADAPAADAPATEGEQPPASQ